MSKDTDSKQWIDDLADESEIPQRPLSQNINSLEKQTALCANHSEVFFLFKMTFKVSQPNCSLVLAGRLYNLSAD